MVLQIKELTVHYLLDDHVVKAVDGVDLDIREGIIIGIVGESGSGKSTLALSVMRLVDPPGEILEGQILFRGQDLLLVSERDMEEIRGSQLSFISQNPTTALNPTMTIGDHLVETIQQHFEIDRVKAIEKAIDALRRVDLPDQRELLGKYPHQLSGGMNQRVMIALSLSCESTVLIADEPTSALDVSTQAQILRLLWSLNLETHTTVILITHSLGITAEICDEVAIMYAGKIMEVGNVRSIFEQPAHPYTQGLINAVPKLDDMTFPQPIPGELSLSTRPDQGCVFYPRCNWAMEVCEKKQPPAFSVGKTRKSYCYLNQS